jgi:hypothetical protein
MVICEQTNTCISPRTLFAKHNFIKSQTNPNMYKSYIHTINFYGKSYKTSKHPNKIHILQKYAIKLIF